MDCGEFEGGLWALIDALIWSICGDLSYFNCSFFIAWLFQLMLF